MLYVSTAFDPSPSRSAMPILLLFFLATLSATAQVYPDTAWSAPCPTDTLTVRPTRCWEGLSFLLLPDEYSPRPYPVSWRRDSTDFVSYDEGVGKIATIRKVSFANDYWEMELVLSDSTPLYYRGAETLGWESQLEGLAWIGDLEFARAHYLGRTVWSILTMPENELYSENPIPVPEITSFGAPREPGYRIEKPRGKQYEPLRIIKVEPSHVSHAPARFHLQTANGRTASINVQISGTNAGDLLAAKHTDFDTSNPRLRYKWPQKTWRKIETGFVEKGMTTDQVRLSWGRPYLVEPSGKGETWHYEPGDLLTFKNGKLVSIELQTGGPPPVPPFSGSDE